MEVERAQDIVRGHLKVQAERQAEDRTNEALYEGKFWKEGTSPTWMEMARADDGLPYKMEVNRVWPFISTHVSNLFLRAPRTEAKAPSVADVKRGRPKKLEGEPEKVEALCNEWLRRSDVKAVARYAYQMALMQGASAFKLGISAGDGPLLSRIWIDALPRWELVQDERATHPDKQAYRGHLRWELASEVEQLLDIELPTDKHKRYALPDPLTDASPASDASPQDKGHHLEEYVLLLEMYDFIEKRQQFYLCTPGEGMKLTEIGEPGGIPWKLPSGRPGIPIIPIVLANVPHRRMEGIPAVRRVANLNADLNLVLTVVGNAFRRDGARKTFYDPDAVDDDFMDKMRSGKDREFIAVTPGQLDRAIRNMDISGFAQTVPQYWSLLNESWRETQGFSELLAGRQLDYATAREVDVVAGAGESTTSEIADRMVSALADTIEMVVAIVVSEHSGSIDVREGDERSQLSMDTLKLPWTFTIHDAATTPIRDEKKKVEWLQVMPIIQGLVEVASFEVPETADLVSEGGTPPPAVNAKMKKFAQLAIDYTVQLYDLPEAMSWTALSLTSEEPRPEPEPPDDRAKQLLPDPGAAAGAEEQAMLERAAATAAQQDMVERAAATAALEDQGGPVIPGGE